MTFVTGKTSLLQKSVARFVKTFHSYGRTYCIYTSISMTCSFEETLHHSKASFQSNDSLLCEGSFAHTGAKTVFEEYYNQSIRLFTQRIPFGSNATGILLKFPYFFNRLCTAVTLFQHSSVALSKKAALLQNFTQL